MPLEIPFGSSAMDGGAQPSLTARVRAGMPPARQVCLVLALLSAAARAGETPYDPLQVPAGAEATVWDSVVSDAVRHRDIPVRVYLPPLDSARGQRVGGAPVVLFSHGLGGSRENDAYLGTHWARRGYVAVFLQHRGSDEAVWKGKPAAERLAALQKAANLEAFLDRVKDVPAVLDQLGRWNGTEGHPLHARLDLGKVGMSGHSFGALTTQAVSGQRMPLTNVSFTDGRIRAALVLSPSVPRRGSAKDAFSGVKIPWLLMTGTNDVAPIGEATVESRLEVFPALPPGRKYELVLDGAAHSVFGDRAFGLDAPRNPKHHPAIVGLSTAFWDATLKDDAAAKKWLDGTGPAELLEPKDRWQKK
jgi:predicted dienelactone hydrolase